MAIIIAQWLFIIFIEIFRNWCIIEVGKKRPTYWWSNCIRVFVGFVFWVVVKMFSDITAWQWWGMIPMMLLTFWWCFDYGLTLFRNIMGKIMDELHQRILFYYLNPNGSWLDQMQCKWMGIWPWFWFKLILMVASIAVAVYGLDSIWIIKVW